MTGYVTDADSNRLESDGTWNYGYDFEGNLTSKTAIAGGEVWVYGYDHRNQLVLVEKQTSASGPVELRVAFAYDVFGYRLQKSVDADGDGAAAAQVTRFVVDAWKTGPTTSFVGTENVDVHLELDADGSLTTRYVRGDVIDELFARVDYPASGGPNPYWYLVDHQGSIREVLDHTGTIRQAVTYDGFGNQQELTVDAAGNVLFLNVSTTVTLVSDADSDGNADPGDVLGFVTLVTNNRGVDLTNVSLTVDLADALRRMPGTVRIYEDASSSTYVEHDVPFSRATVFRNGSWFIDDNQNGYYDATDATAYYGAPGDLPVLGDWNGDGIDEIGVFRNGTWYLDATGDGIYGEGDATITFGQAGDLPVVGEWDGTGHDRIGVFRNGTWYLDSNGSGAYDAGDATLVFGTTGDKPVVGDWAGVDQPRIGVYRNGTWYLDSNGSGAYDAGDATLVFGGTPGDMPVVGDWNSDGSDDIAVYSAGQFYYDSDGSGTYNAGDQSTIYGQSGDIAVAGTPPIRPYIIQNMAAGQTARIEYEARIHPAVASGTLTTRTLISGTAGSTAFTQPAWEDKITVGSPPPTQQETPDYIGRYGYTGREWEAEIQLQFNRGRYYDPATGRWISQDPLGFDAGDSNLYRYVHNRPTGATDPSGLQDSNVQTRFIPIELFQRYSKQISPGTGNAYRPAVFGEEIGGAEGRLYTPISPEEFRLVEELQRRETDAAKGKEILNNLKRFGTQLADIGTSIAPVVSDIRDWSEVLSGRDAISGEKLSVGERIATGAAAILPFVPAKPLRGFARWIGGFFRRGDDARDAARAADGLRGRRPAGAEIQEFDPAFDPPVRTPRLLTEAEVAARMPDTARLGHASAARHWHTYTPTQAEILAATRTVLSSTADQVHVARRIRLGSETATVYTRRVPIQGQQRWFSVAVYESGPNAGRFATAVEPTIQQLRMHGLAP